MFEFAAIFSNIILKMIKFDDVTGENKNNTIQISCRFDHPQRILIAGGSASG